MSYRPRTTTGRTIETTITDVASGGSLTVYLTTGEYDDGSLCEVFLKASKHGSTLGGLLDWVAITISQSLQSGVSLDELCRVSEGLSYPPFGPTDDPDVPECMSISNYVLSKLASLYLCEARAAPGRAS